MVQILFVNNNIVDHRLIYGLIKYGCKKKTTQLLVKKSFSLKSVQRSQL